MSRSELVFGAFLAYCPRGDGEVHEQSRRWRDALKNDAPVGNPARAMTTLVAQRMSASLAGTPLEGFFRRDTVLVPVPGSSIQQPGQLWVPKRIAAALVMEGVGSEVSCNLRRTKSVRKSATAKPDERPRMRDHFESLAVEGSIGPGPDFVLIDDVVTRGATLMASALKLREWYPQASIRAFAVMRAVSEPEAFEAVRSPVVGTIRLQDSGECFRRP
jgi:hypothetical protein